jgi:mono/diheme cytochrome c family protein
MSSESSSESKNPIATLIGWGFLILVPFSLVVMLGYVGLEFVRSMKRDPKPEAAVAAVPTAPAASAPAASAPAPAGGETAAAPAPPAGGGTAVDPAVMALGKTSYALCAACHGPDGKGLQAGPALMAPPLVGSELLLGDPEKPLLVVLKGIAKENMNYMGVMAPLAAGLDDQKLAAVLTYVRNEWGNSAPPVTVEQAAAVRAKYSALNPPMGIKRGEIDQIVAAHK